MSGNQGMPSTSEGSDAATSTLVDAADVPADAARDAGPGAKGCLRYRDADGDGVGGSETTNDCLAGGYVMDPGDCDDQSVWRSPRRSEACDGKDNDCDGQVDEEVCPASYETADWEGAGYLRLTEPVDWLTAENQCASAGMRMVKIETQAENDFLWGFAKGFSTWLGGSDTAVEGEWRWRDGESFWFGDKNGTAAPDSFVVWLADSEPNGDDPEDCLMYWHAYDTAVWADDPCDDPHAALCEPVL